MTKKLVKGNKALAEAAILAGVRFFAGYPITPSTEILEYFSKELSRRGGVFRQAASEIEAISMVYGAASTGVRSLTASSGPGISLMQEGISYIACSEVPCVIVNMMRAGPGLGGIQAAQGDYFQAVKGGGHGDYHLIVLAPSSVQELVDFTIRAFDLAEKYRIPVMILGDGVLGQMEEPVEFPDPVDLRDSSYAKDWAVGIREGREPNLIVPFDINADGLEQINIRLQEKYERIRNQEPKAEVSLGDGCNDIVLAGYGLVGRIILTVKDMAEADGLKVGLVRPITLWPFPREAFVDAAKTTDKILVVEMSAGQMVEDVQLSVMRDSEVNFYGRTGGNIPTPVEIYEEVKKIVEQKAFATGGV